jgi:hypothetical protein
MEGIIMRARNIIEYVTETPYNVNTSFLNQMLEQYAADKANPMSQYTLDVDINPNTDLLGKHIDDLQKNISIIDGKFYGVLHYVRDYTGFSGDPEEQNGYYICFHVAYDGAETIKVNGVTLDEDGIHIIIIKNTAGEPKAKIEITKDGETFTDEISFGGLKYEGAGYDDYMGHFKPGFIPPIKPFKGGK